MLTFGKGNAKLGKHVATFSLPAGWTCPAAKDCMARANRETGKITDGPDTVFRCFAASAEAVYPAVRDSRWSNLDILKGARTSDKMASVILASMPKGAAFVRIHVSGDFFSAAYLKAWTIAAAARPDITFYAYTKSVHLLPQKAQLPGNLRIVVSAGTKFELETARKLGYSVAFVVFSDGGALPIDHDDSHAIAADHDFALLLHGTQPKGTEASAALSALRRAGHKGYARA